MNDLADQPTYLTVTTGRWRHRLTRTLEVRAQTPNKIVGYRVVDGVRERTSDGLLILETVNRRAITRCGEA